MWSRDADEVARNVVRRQMSDLYEEAERVAARSGADTVGPAYVSRAATNIGLRRESLVWADILLAVGLAMTGLSGGVLATDFTATQVHLHSWVTPVAVGVLVLGVALAAVGTTRKALRR
jgi:hypothetical protein